MTPSRPGRSVRGALAVAVAIVVAVGASGCTGKDEVVPPVTVAQQEAAPKRLVHVDKAARGRSDGTRARPFRTIQRALAELGPGVGVVLHAGRYHEHLELRRGGTRSAPAVLRAASGQRVELVGRLKIVADNVSVSGLVFTGGDGEDENVLVYVSRAENVVLRGNEVRDAKLSGIFVGDASARVKIVSNWIHDNGTDPGLDHGIYVERNTGGTISDNVIDENVGYGIQLYPDADGMVVTHNTIVGNGRSGIVLGGESTTSDTNVVANNVVAFNAEQGIRTFWGASTGIDNRVVSNLVFGNPQGNLSLRGVEEVNMVEEDPRFVAIDRGDYRLSEDSPAVDEAAPEYQTPRDFAGMPRPQNEASDIGAYERPVG
jgi:parallel beta-helix repeat protein